MNDAMLKRLQDDSDGGPGDRLAQLMLEQLLRSRVDSLVAPQALAAAAREALQGWLDSPEAMKSLETSLELTVASLKSQAALRDLVPRDVKATLLELAARPYSPDKRVVLKILDRGPMRELIRTLVTDTVSAFGARMAAPAATVTKGLGGLARFAAETVKQRGGALGGIVGAVEGQVEKRSVEFADAAISRVLNEIADFISDPKQAADAAQLRVEALSGALELTPVQLSRELINLDVPGGAEVLRAGLKRWLQSADATATFERVAQGARVEQTVGELLDGVGQRPVALSLGRALLRSRLKVLFASPEYAAWLDEVGRP
ncbi:MAG: hypothetical protein IPJ65_25820 [Archangiaceae bacterium]|nr:hypothetical protein [Archangiaceae bacterium]